MPSTYFMCLVKTISSLVHCGLGQLAIRDKDTDKALTFSITSTSILVFKIIIANLYVNYNIQCLQKKFQPKASITKFKSHSMELTLVKMQRVKLSFPEFELLLSLAEQTELKIPIKKRVLFQSQSRRSKAAN